MFTYFTDRDGKYQLLALAESAFDPLSRTTRFMLTEEAHHMFVGETGILRIVQRTAEALEENPDADLRKLGLLDLPLLQRYMNFWYAISLDLFGGEISSNAAAYFASGIKGRAYEDRYDDHVALDDFLRIAVPEEGGLIEQEVPLRNAMNEVLRNAYSEDSERGVAKFNKLLAAHNVDFRFRLPSSRFHRNQGLYAGLHFDPDGNPISEEAFAENRDEWLPSEADYTYVHSVMSGAVTEVGQMANWIAPPKSGIKGRPIDYEYVRLD